MVLAGVFPKEMNRKIMMTTIEKLFPIKNIATPYMYHHVTEALFVAGLKEEATELMKNYWGQMIRLGADTFGKLLIRISLIIHHMVVRLFLVIAMLGVVHRFI